MEMISTDHEYAVDVVFCLDVTGSMYPILELLQQGALTLHQQLTRVAAARDRTVDDLRLRVVAFRDFRDNAADALELSPFFRVPEEAAGFAAFVGNLYAGGGGDEPESGLEALAVALDSPWAGAVPRRHLVVLLTDASAHPLGVGRAASTYPACAPANADDLRQSWAARAGSVQRLVLFAPDTVPWRAIAGEWDRTTYCPTRSGEGLKEYDWSTIVDTIGAGI